MGERILAAACLTVAAGSLAVGIGSHAAKPRGLGDFPCYYYAARVAMAGGDPYELDALNALARTEIGRPINPYFYPPPFLIVVAPLGMLPVGAARIAWLALETAAVAGSFLLLGKLLVTEGRASMERVVLLLGIVAATYPAIEDDLVMGQANGLVLLAILGGLRCLATRRELAGGALLGAAAMLKMSPAILLGWLVLRRRGRALLGAGAAALLLSALALPLAGAAVQRTFYAELLPAFSHGFPGVKLRLDWIGNHSLPSAVDGLLPGPDARTLSPAGRSLVVGIQVALLAVAAWLIVGRRGDRAPAALEPALLLVFMVAFPPFAFEHHLLYLLPPLALTLALAMEGSLPLVWSVAVVVGYGLLAIRPAHLASAEALRGSDGAWALLPFAVRRAKLAGMAILAGAVAAALFQEKAELPAPPGAKIQE